VLSLAAAFHLVPNSGKLYWHYRTHHTPSGSANLIFWLGENVSPGKHVHVTPETERMIGADPKSWLLGKLAGKASNQEGLGLFDPRALAEYVRCFDGETIHATCEDYRAAATIDIAHDDIDGDDKLTQPLLALWGAKATVARCFDVLNLWRKRADLVVGESLPSGHFIPEECPDLLTERLLRHFV
jgi:haloacetate dehalogenase